MADAHANFATSTVATAPSPATSGTSLVVTTGEGARFPAVPFNAVIAPADALATSANAEIVRVTDRSTDTLTITRTQEGTSARTVGVGDRIYAGITAKTLTDIEIDYEQGFSAWKDLGPPVAGVVGAAGTGTFIAWSQGYLALNTAGNDFNARYIDPAWFAVTGRTMKVRLVMSYRVGGTGPGAGITLTWGIASAATWMTASAAARPGIATLNTALTTTAVTGPAAQARNHLESNAAQLTPAGDYVISLVISGGSTAANSNVDTQLQMQYQLVP